MKREKKSQYSFEKKIKMTKFSILSENITLKMRCIVVDYMIELCYKCQLKDCTLHTSVILHDKYISLKKDIKPEDYQKIAVTSLMIASKLKEYSILGIEECMTFCNNIYTASQIRECEHDMILELKFDILVPDLYSFFARNIAQDTDFITMFYLDSCLLDIDILYAFNFEEIVDACNSLSKKLDNNGSIHENIQQYTALQKQIKESVKKYEITYDAASRKYTNDIERMKKSQLKKRKFSSQEITDAHKKS